MYVCLCVRGEVGGGERESESGEDGIGRYDIACGGTGKKGGGIGICFGFDSI